MAKLNVITSMLDDLFAEQPIHTALAIGQQLKQFKILHIWLYNGIILTQLSF